MPGERAGRLPWYRLQVARRGLVSSLSAVVIAAVPAAVSAQPGPHDVSGPDDDPPGSETIATDRSVADEGCQSQVPPDSSDRGEREPCEAWCGQYPSFEDKPRVAIGVDLLPEIGTSAGYEDNHVRHLSLNLIGGYSGGLEGLELSTALSFTTSHVYGVQLGGLFNLAGGQLYGVQGVGLLNAVSSSPYGLQAAGGMNIAGGVPRGLQLAGAVNFANDGVYGAQIAGAANLAGGLDGVQLSGALNILDSERGQGAQVSAVNIASAGFEGAQVGAVNVSGPGETHLQIGVINVAEQTDFSLGLFNVLYGGRSHVDVWFADTGFVHAGFKHGGRWFHNIYAVGGRSSGGPQGSVAFGIGSHWPLPSELYLDVDLLAHAIVPDHADGGTVPLLGTLRAVGNGRLSEAVSLLAGVSYNVLYSEEPDRGESYPLFGDHEIRSTSDGVIRGWPGFVLGLQFLPAP